MKTKKYIVQSLNILLITLVILLITSCSSYTYQSNYSFNPLSIKSIEEAVKHAIDDNMGKQSKILIKNETKNFINFLTK